MEIFMNILIIEKWGNLFKFIIEVLFWEISLFPLPLITGAGIFFVQRRWWRTGDKDKDLIMWLPLLGTCS